MKRTSVVILAGGTSKELYVRFGTTYWAFVPIKKRSMIDYVIDAFRTSGARDIIVVGKWTTGLSEYRGCRVIEGGAKHFDNVAAGLLAAKYEKVIISTCDIPSLTAKAVTDFSIQCIGDIPGAFFPITLVSDCEKAFPGMKRTSLPLCEGVVTAGNIFLVDRDRILARLETIRPLLKNKKSKIKLALQFGLIILIKVFVSMKTGKPMLSLEKLEQRASKMLGMPVKAVWADPSIASDIDTLKQLDQYLGIL